MHAFYPLSLGHLANIVFVVAVLSVLWLTFKKNKVIALGVLAAYVLMFLLIHFINRSDDKYSDVSHGVFGSWSILWFGICLLLVIASQVYVLIPKKRKT
jgi:hypothetical protein